MQLLLERGADPNKRFAGQFHSTQMPNTDRFDNTPFFRAAIAADVEALKVLIAHGADLEQTPPVEAAPERKPGDISRRGAPRQSERRPHAGDGGDDRRPRAGDDGRARLHPRRRGAVPRAREPEAGRRVRAAAHGGREPEREGARRHARCCTRPRGRATSR